jgi:hypothetical protein
MLTPTERRELEELREKAKKLNGLYVGDALKYAQLLGQRGLTKPKIMLAARQHRLGAFQPKGGKWWVFPLAGLEAYYGSERMSDETA